MAVCSRSILCVYLKCTLCLNIVCPFNISTPELCLIQSVETQALQRLQAPAEICDRCPAVFHSLHSGRGGEGLSLAGKWPLGYGDVFRHTRFCFVVTLHSSLTDQLCHTETFALAVLT